MNIRHWWKIVTKETRNSPTFGGGNLFQYHFVLHKTYTERPGLQLIA